MNPSTPDQLFATPTFDAQTAANSLLASYGSQLSAALAQLSLSIEDIGKQLRADVAKNHLQLLAKASSLATLDGDLRTVRHGLEQIQANVDRLQTKIGKRHHSLDLQLASLKRYQEAAEICRRVARFVGLAKRLDSQMKHLSTCNSDQRELALADAASSIAELEYLLNSDDRDEQAAGSITDLRAVAAHVRSVISARQRVEEDMGRMLDDGLRNLDRSLLAASFQTAFNLSVLGTAIAERVGQLGEGVRARVRLTFDGNALAKQAAIQDPAPPSAFVYKSRARTEPTSNNAPQWTNLLWTRLESLIDDLTTSCIKVYTLEKVLEWKKDGVTGTSFLDQILNGPVTVLDSRPSTVFWTAVGSALEKEVRDASRGSSFITQTLSSSYPRLLRLFHDFFTRISLHTSTTYTSTTQSPETVLTLRAIAPFEAVYLDRSTARMAEAVNSRSAATAEKVGAVLWNELDKARFDPLLLRSVAKRMGEILDAFVKRVEDRISMDYQPLEMAGPVATPLQIQYLELSTVLSTLTTCLSHILQEYPDDLANFLGPIQSRVSELNSGSIIDPLLTCIKRELSGLVIKMHEPAPTSSSGSYIDELVKRLLWVKTELISRLANEAQPAALQTVANDMLTTFLLQATLRTPLSAESTKLELTAELTKLEFNLAQFFIDEEDDKAIESLRCLRQLLFAEKLHDCWRGALGILDRLVIIQLVVGRAGDQGIHKILGWSQGQYGRWIEEHPRWASRKGLVYTVLADELDDATGAKEWAGLVKEILEEQEDKDGGV